MTGSLDPTNNWVSATNVTGFSDWGITDQGGPTAVTLSSFTAQHGFDLGAWFRQMLGLK